MMRRRNIIIGLAVLIAIAAGLWLAEMREKTPHESRSSLAPTLQPRATGTPLVATGPLPKEMPKGPYQGMGDPRWPIYWAKLEQDHSFEWKTPINLYGKVIDQDGQPIEGATIEVSWTVLTSVSSSGSLDRLLVSDANGLFSMSGERGKRLVAARLKKDGYVAASASNRYEFEYAGFWEPSYCELDPNNPVLFRMRKLGEQAKLTTSQGKVVVEFGKPVTLPMPSDLAATQSPITVTIYESHIQPKKWLARVAVEGGGILPALEEFPFEAPESGYQSALDLDQDSPLPPGWQDIDEGGWFYIKTQQGYGLLELRQMKGKKTLHYDVRINPTGSRNLQPAQSN